MEPIILLKSACELSSDPSKATTRTATAVGGCVRVCVYVRAADMRARVMCLQYTIIMFDTG